MRRCVHILALALTTLTLGATPAQAGRIGGPASEVGVIGPYQSTYFDVAFAGGEPAIVTLSGNGNTVLDLRVYDGDGQIWRGVGFADRRALTIAVYRPGLLRIEVRNLGPVANAFVIGTN